MPKTTVHGGATHESDAVPAEDTEEKTDRAKGAAKAPRKRAQSPKGPGG